MKATLTLHGIKNCDSVKKARRWLDTHHIDYTFNDVRDDGIDADLVYAWLRHSDAGTLVNRRSTSWKNLETKDKETVTQLIDALNSTEQSDTSSALQLASFLAHNPLLIKRPVVIKNQINNQIKNQISDQAPLIGFNEKQYSKTLL